MDKKRFETIVKIVERAEAMGIGYGDRFTKLMDIENADNQFELRLDDFLNADNLDFVHDFTGIQAHINRETFLVEDFFLPRFATPKKAYKEA